MEKKESRTQVCWCIPLTFSQRLQTTLRGEAAWACTLRPTSHWTCAMWGWLHSQIWKKATYGCIISAFFRWGQCPFKQVIRLGGHLDNALGRLFSSYARAASICLNEGRPKALLSLRLKKNKNIWHITTKIWQKCYPLLAQIGLQNISNSI